jgi:hypothetical protein
MDRSDRRAGFLPLIAGFLLVLIAAFDPRDGAFSSGRAPVVAAGLVFGLAGLAVVISGLETPYRGALLALNGTALLGCFALVPLAIAWTTGLTWPLMIAGVVCLGLVGLGVRGAIREFLSVRRSAAARARASAERPGGEDPPSAI